MILSIHYKIYPEKKLIPSSTYITILVKSLIDLIFLSNFVLVFKMSLYYHTGFLNSSDPCHSWGHGGVQWWDSWNIRKSRQSPWLGLRGNHESKLLVNILQQSKLFRIQDLFWRSGAEEVKKWQGYPWEDQGKQIFGWKFQESGFGVKQGIYHSLELSKTDAGSGLPVVDRGQAELGCQSAVPKPGGRLHLMSS